MNNFLKNKRELISIVVYVCIIILLVYFAVLPLVRQINAASDKIQEENLKQEIAKQQLEESPKMQQQYDDLLREDRLERVLAEKEKAVELIEKLEKLAQETGNEITISVTEAQATVKNAPQKKNQQQEKDIISLLPSPDFLQLKLTVMGDYNSSMNFLHKLENFPYYSDVVGIQIKGYDQEKEKNGSVAADPFAVRGEVTKSKDTNSGGNKLESTFDVAFYIKK